MRHLVVPDTQIRKGVPTDHIEALGNYIVAKQPEVIILLGDWWDMPSLSSYASAYEKEGGRLEDDIESGFEGLDRLIGPLEAYNKRRKHKYKPKMYFITGNHENRLNRYLDAHPELKGLESFEYLKRLKQYGIKVIPFLEPKVLNGISYAHYFYAKLTGRALGGTAQSKLNKLKFSYVQGHVPNLCIAREQLNNGKVIRGLVAGTFCMHKEDFHGPQGDHWNGVIMLNDVKNGDYSLCEVQLDFLLKHYL